MLSHRAVAEWAHDQTRAHEWVHFSGFYPDMDSSVRKRIRVYTTEYGEEVHHAVGSYPSDNNRVSTEEYNVCLLMKRLEVPYVPSATRFIKRLEEEGIYYEEGGQ